MTQAAVPLAHFRADDHPRQFVCASIVLGRWLMELETDAERKGKKRRVLERRLALMQDALPADDVVTDIYAVKAAGGYTREHAAAVVVDLAFGSPFSPYELAYSDKHFDVALHKTGTEMNFAGSFVDRVFAVKREALGVHEGPLSSVWSLVAAGGVLTTVALPFLPAALGAWAGLAGAAATSHGLALLGAGSLAMHGLGMAGGTWVLAGLTGAALATTGYGATELLHAITPEALRAELAKCQATVVLGMENGSWTRDDVRSRLSGFEALKRSLEEDLSDEQALNDSGARRISAIKDKLKALAAARSWIEKKLG